jgi:hypothetical protein
VTSNNCRLPNLIIAGVHKAGTTSLYSYLGKHPQICPSFRKEIGFFVPLMFDREIPALEEYSKYFTHCGNEYFRMEASPSYLYGKEKIAEAIRKAIPDAKIIVILRDPTDRLLSFFSRAVSKSALPEDIGLNDYLSVSKQKINSAEHDVYSRGVREGLYIEYIRPWQRAFGHNMKVVFFDDLQQSALGLTRNICAWLGLDTTCLESQDFSVENKTRQYRYRKLHRYVKDVYMKSEAFWREHYRLKQRLRNIYNMFNADAASTLRTVDEAGIAKLRALYEPYNQELKVFLESNNYASLPRWLN